MSAEEIKGIALLMRTFPGSRLLPKFQFAEPLGGCVVCDHSVALKNMAGEYVHIGCEYARLGIEQG